MIKIGKIYRIGVGRDRKTFRRSIQEVAWMANDPFARFDDISNRWLQGEVKMHSKFSRNHKATNKRLSPLVWSNF